MQTESGVSACSVVASTSVAAPSGEDDDSGVEEVAACAECNKAGPFHSKVEVGDIVGDAVTNDEHNCEGIKDAVLPLLAQARETRRLLP